MQNIIHILLRRLHAPLIVLVCVYAVAVLGFVLIPGVDNNGQPWHMDFLHAFYFVTYMGTTIGFGEIPYPFTPGQRLWTTLTIYGTVIVWLYGIGTAMSLLQESSFRAILRRSAFNRAVQRTSEPFYLVCGYGDTGKMLVHALADAKYRTVVIDVDPACIDNLELEDLGAPIPGFAGDAALPENLVLAGLTRSKCLGVLALTNDDNANLKIAITAKLLKPQLPVVARAEARETGSNMDSFGTDYIIDPFDTFAGRLALALHAPGIFLLYEWMTAVPHESLREPLFPPRGRWILCGFGRFGKAVYRRLSAEGIPVTIIEARPDLTDAPPDVIIGRGTEARTLHEAGITDAVGIVAGTDNDTNNLSIIMTAQNIKRSLFTVARQNLHHNDRIFEAARPSLVMQRGSVTARKIFALITTPLLTEFLRQAREEGNDWANQLVSRIGGIVGDEAPHKWGMEITPACAPALYAGIVGGSRPTVGDLCRNPRNRDERLDCMVLFIKRIGAEIVLPGDEMTLEKGDHLLLCGRIDAWNQMEWISKNHNVFDYLCSGEERASGTLWKWLSRRRTQAS